MIIYLPSRTVTQSMQTTTIEFLPSAFGPGTNGSVSGWYGAHDPVDGWLSQDYSHVAGVARQPSKDRMDSDGWLATVVARLRRQGVLFIDQQQEQQYLQGEGLYWLWRFGLRRPRLRQRILWTIKSPPTPLSKMAAMLAHTSSVMRSYLEVPLTEPLQQASPEPDYPHPIVCIRQQYSPQHS